VHTRYTSVMPSVSRFAAYVIRSRHQGRTRWQEPSPLRMFGDGTSYRCENSVEAVAIDEDVAALSSIAAMQRDSRKRFTN